jgi:hypothetical protein
VLARPLSEVLREPALPQVSSVCAAGVGRLRARGDEPGFIGGDDGLGAVAEPELVEDVAHVCLDRFLGDDEPAGNLGVGEAMSHEGQNFGLAVLALAVGTALRRSAAAVTTVIVLIVLPYVLVFASALPTGVSDWLLRLTPAAAFAVEQTLPQYHQVNYLYTPSAGFYPLAPGLGLAVLAAYTVGALLIARHLLRTRDV